MIGPKPKLNPLEMQARSQGVQPQPWPTPGVVWCSLLLQGRGKKDGPTEDRLQKTGAEVLCFQAVVMTVVQV